MAQEPPIYPTPPRYPGTDPTATPGPALPAQGLSSGRAPGRSSGAQYALAALAIVAVVLFCCLGGNIVFRAFGAGPSLDAAGSAATATATATATSTPVPPTVAALPTVDPQVAVYAALVTRDLATLAPAMQQTGTDCQAQDLSACRADLQQVSAISGRFLTDLSKTPAPPCLDAADTQLWSALLNIESGADLAVQGIDASDASEINQGAQLVEDGGQALHQATLDVQQSQCS